MWLAQLMSYNNQTYYFGYRAELEKSCEKFDIIVGDLADPVEGGPCYQLYTKSFYEQILKPKLNHGGIFVTQVDDQFMSFFFQFFTPTFEKHKTYILFDMQAGPAGIFTHKEVFTSIFNTIKQVFKCKYLPYIYTRTHIYIYICMDVYIQPKKLAYVPWSYFLKHVFCRCGGICSSHTIFCRYMGMGYGM